MDAEKKESRNDMILAVHRALVETYALKEAGQPLAMDYYSLDPTEDYAELVAGGARFERDANGETTLLLESERLRHSILECVTPKDRLSDDRAMEDTEAEEEEEITEDISEEEVESREAEERPFQVVKEDGEINLELEGSEVAAGDEESFDPARSSDHAALMPASGTWRNVSLEDAAIKFAVSGPRFRLHAEQPC